MNINEDGCQPWGMASALVVIGVCEILRHPFLSFLFHYKAKPCQRSVSWWEYNEHLYRRSLHWTFTRPFAVIYLVSHPADIHNTSYSIGRPMVTFLWKNWWPSKCASTILWTERYTNKTLSYLVLKGADLTSCLHDLTSCLSDLTSALSYLTSAECRLVARCVMSIRGSAVLWAEKWMNEHLDLHCSQRCRYHFLSQWSHFLYEQWHFLSQWSHFRFVRQFEAHCVTCQPDVQWLVVLNSFGYLPLVLIPHPLNGLGQTYRKPHKEYKVQWTAEFLQGISPHDVNFSIVRNWMCNSFTSAVLVGCSTQSRLCILWTF